MREKFETNIINWLTFILCILGILALIFVKEMDLRDKITVGVLGFTALMIMLYTKETYQLKMLERINLKFQKAPFVIVHYQPSDYLVFKNVGRGVARNITWRIEPLFSQSAVEWIEVQEIVKTYNITIISPPPAIQNYTEISNHHFEILDPRPRSFSSSRQVYKIIIDYQDMNGRKYFTELKSGMRTDDYEILDYDERK